MSSDRIERTGWLIGAALLGASLFLRSLPVSGGVALGALLALLNYNLLARFVRSVVAAERPAHPRARFALYLTKYAVAAAALFAALRFNLVDAFAILVGASVLLPAIGWETVASRRTLTEET
jgi:hypothetical protein